MRVRLLAMAVLCGALARAVGPVALSTSRELVASNDADPTDLAMASAAWLVVALASWVTVACVTICLASAVSAPRLRALPHLIAPRPLQRWTHGLVGLSLTAGLAAPAPGAGLTYQDPPSPTATSAEHESGTATLRPLGPAPTTPAGADATRSAPSTTGTADLPTTVAPSTTTSALEPTTTTTSPRTSDQEPTGAGPPATTTTPTPPSSREGSDEHPVEVPEAAAPEAGWQTPPSADPLAGEQVTVEVGDSFWSIAKDQLGPDSDDRAVVAYWSRLIELNRDRLIVPGEPDLIYPGQVFVLPE